LQNLRECLVGSNSSKEKFGSEKVRAEIICIIINLDIISLSKFLN